jgi:hypothetical protein
MGRVPLATAWPGSGCVCESHEALPGHEASFVAAGNPTFGRPLRLDNGPSRLIRLNRFRAPSPRIQCEATASGADRGCYCSRRIFSYARGHDVVPRRVFIESNASRCRRFSTQLLSGAGVGRQSNCDWRHSCAAGAWWPRDRPTWRAARAVLQLNLPKSPHKIKSPSTSIGDIQRA